MFGVVRLTENADIDKYKYSVYVLDLIKQELFHLTFSVDLIIIGCNMIIFWAGMIFSVRNDNKGKDILILWKGPAKELGEYSLTV